MIKNSLNKIILILIFLISYNVLNTEESTPLNSDRPGQAMTPITLSPGGFQLQSGFYYNKTKYTLPYNEDFLIFGFPFEYNYQNYYTNQVVRYGLTKNFEFNLNLSYIKIEQKISVAFKNNNNLTDTIVGEQSSNGIGNLGLGVRYNFTDNSNDNSFAIQTNLGIYESRDFRQENVYPLNITAIYVKKINEDFILNLNLGNSTNLNFNDDIFIDNTTINYVINFGYNINKDFGVFVENYGYYNVNKVENHHYSNFDAGFYYLVNNNLQLDIYGGSNLITNSTNIVLENTFFIGTGISYRFNQK